MAVVDSGYLFYTLGYNPMLLYFVVQSVLAPGLWSSLNWLLDFLPGSKAYERMRRPSHCWHSVSHPHTSPHSPSHIFSKVWFNCSSQFIAVAASAPGKQLWSLTAWMRFVSRLQDSLPFNFSFLGDPRKVINFQFDFFLSWDRGAASKLFTYQSWNRKYSTTFDHLLLPHFYRW